MNFTYTPNPRRDEFTYSFSFTSVEFMHLRWSEDDEAIREGLFHETSIAARLAALALIARKAEEHNQQHKE